MLSVVKKEIEPFDPSQPVIVDSTNNGTDTLSNDTTSTVNSFNPLSTGSWWKYKDSASGSVSTNTVGSDTRTFSSIVYKALVSTTDTQTDTLWAASPQPDYYLAAKGVSPSGSTYDLTFYYLNDTASVGYSKRYNAGSGNDFTAYITTTIIAKDLTMTIAGKTYTNITQTRLDLSYDFFGTVTESGFYNYFTAKGVGIVKIRAEVELGGISVLQTCSDLTDYHIE